MKRRIFCVIMTIVVCSVLMPIFAFATEPLWNAEIIETQLQASWVSITDDGLAKYEIYDDDDHKDSEAGLINNKGEYVYTRYPEWRYDPNSNDYDTQYISAYDLYSCGNYILDGNDCRRYAKYSSVHYQDYDADDLYWYDDYKIISKIDGKTYYCSDIISKYLRCNAGEVYICGVQYCTDERSAVVHAMKIDSEYHTLTDDYYYVDLNKLTVQNVISALIDGESAAIAPLSEGLMSYAVFDYETESDPIKQLGYLDRKGNKGIVLDSNYYETCGDFSCGLAYVSAKNSHKYGYIDTSGKLVIPCIYKYAYLFEDGYACVENALGKYGVIDTFGNTVIPFKWDYLQGASSGLFVAENYDSDSVCLIDKNGTEIINNAYWITECRNNSAYMLDNDHNLYVIKLTPAVPGIVSFIYSDGDMSACILMPDGNNGYAFCVCYDASDRLLSIKSTDLKSGLNDGLIFERDDQAATAKLFVIDGSSRPLFEAGEVRAK